jgi:predicted nucleic acid-binding protein
LNIYCDTNALFNNVNDLVELAALEELLRRHERAEVVMSRSAVALREVMDTTNQEQRHRLLSDYEAQTPIPLDERVHAIESRFDHRGCSSTFPIVSDVQDEQMCRELVEHGLSFRDAQHITQAVCNGCDVFLTRDRQTIIDPHREWLEARFPNLKIRLPSELV